jgi:hypothetical protein
MKKFLFVLAALAVSSVGQSAQVDPALYKATGATGHFYGRTDGLFQENTSKGLVTIENGYPARLVGVGYDETFAYGVSKGLASGTWAAWATASTTAGTVNMLDFGSGLRLMQVSLASGSAAPTMTASGLEINAGATNTYGVELVGGILGASGRPFVVGRDPAFKFCAKAYTTTVAGHTYFYAGFRKSEPFQATYTSYATYAQIGHKAGTIYTNTESAGGGNTETSGVDTISDATTHTFCALVSSAGVTTFTVDGTAPATTQAYTFPSGASIVPYVMTVESSTTSAHTYLTDWLVAYQ